MQNVTAMPALPPVDPRVHERRWLTLGVLCLSLVIIVMDNTILNVAIPSLMKDLGATSSQVQWIIDSYTLVFAGLLLTFGSLSDRFGRKGALQLGIVLFGLGSAASAMADSADQLIATRAFMGIGGALIMPATLSILTNVFREPQERARAIAIWAGCSGLAVALGPILGGVLIEHFSWSAVFWINIPLGGIALVLGAFFVPTSRDPSHARLDLLGSALSIVGLAALLFGIIEGPSRGWTDAAVIAGFVLGAVLLTAFVLWELHSSHPMLDMRFFRNPRFSAANTAVTITFFAMFGSILLMTQYWQLVHGYSPLEAGLRLLPYAATMMIVSPMSARFVERAGTKRVVALGLVLIAAGMGMLSFIQRETSYSTIIGMYVVMAIGMAMTMGPATESVMGSLPPAKAGVGSAMNDTTRQVGGALGVAVIGSAVSTAYVSQIDDLVPRFGLGPEAGDAAAGSIGGALQVAGSMGDTGREFAIAAQDAFVSAMSVGMRVGVAVLLLAAVVVWRFLPARAVVRPGVVAVDTPPTPDGISPAGAAAVE